jgi:Na+/H+ antiporter NhaD/arsenite permease-like protein
VSALPLVLFAATYLGLALGRVPWLKLDRTGFAILGAVAFLATGEISLEEAKTAVDAPTIVVLFGMMLLSVQYRAAGLYDAIADRLAQTRRPERLLLGVIVATAGLSAVLTNDVVCFAMTPLVAGALLRTRLDPVPYVLAIACASNLGSALTPIGNPQAILIARRLDLAFVPFVLACAPATIGSLAFLYWFLRRRLRERDVEPVAPAAVAAVAPAPAPERHELDRPQAAKAILLTAGAIALFLTPVPAHLTALAVAGLVLLSRRREPREALGLVDWQMLAMFAGLFVVVRGLELSGWVAAAREGLLSAGADLASPWVLAPSVAVLGNLVGNVPAVMLLLPFVPATPETGHLLALVSTFAGNALLVGSIANLIVAEQAARAGVAFGFREHLRVGLPVTAVSLALATGSALSW